MDDNFVCAFHAYDEGLILPNAKFKCMCTDIPYLLDVAFISNVSPKNQCGNYLNSTTIQ